MKVSVIGAGAVGVSVCQYLLLNGSCDNLVLVDLNDEKAKGEILDFGGLLGYGPIMPVNQRDPSVFINRGGRLPAPMQSLKN